MSTGDKKLNIYLKKFISQQQMVENFQEFLLKVNEDLYKRIFSVSGVYRGGFLTSSLADTFDISVPLEGSNSIGKDIKLDPSDSVQIPFENESGVDYNVGLRSVTIPDSVETNLKTGKLKYVFFKELIGELSDPTSVVDDGDGTLTIIVDSVFESGVDHSGRTVRVFLKSTEDGGSLGPLSLAVPTEDLVVQWNGSNNFIETTTALGQTATSISVDTNDYQVVAIGATVRRNTDLTLVPTVIFLGLVRGAGVGVIPTIFDQTNRRVLSTGSASAGGSGFNAQIFSVLEEGGTISHSNTTVGEVTFTEDLKYRPFGVTGELTITAQTVTLADDEVAFITIPDPFVSATPIIEIAARTSAGLTSTDRFWIFHRTGNKITIRGGLTIEQGENRQLSDVVIDSSIFFGEDDKIRYTDTDNIYHLDSDGVDDDGNLAIKDTTYFGNPTNNDKFSFTGGLNGVLSFLYSNSVLNAVISTGLFTSLRANTTDPGFETSVNGDAFSRFKIDADGRTEWGNGTVSADTDLFREAAGILATTNILKSLIGTLRLNDIDISRESADLLAIDAELRVVDGIIRAGLASNNDFLRFVDDVAPENTFWQAIINNVVQFKVDENGDSNSTRDSKTESNTGYKKVDDSVITGVDASLNEVYDQTKGRDLLKIKPNNPYDTSVVISASQITLASGEKVGLVNGDGVLVDFTSGDIDFSTGIVTGGSNFTAHTPSAASVYYKYGVGLNNSNNVVIILPTGDSLVESTAPEPTFLDLIPLGVVTVQDDGSNTQGAILNINEDSILKFNIIEFKKDPNVAVSGFTTDLISSPLTVASGNTFMHPNSIVEAAITLDGKYVSVGGITINPGGSITLNPGSIINFLAFD